MSSAAVANPLVVVAVAAAAAGADGLEDDGDENVGFAASPMEAKISSCFGFGGCGLLIIGVFRDVVAPKEDIVAAGMAGVGADTGAETTRDEDVGALSSSQSSQSSIK
jgi:hypothetical protein